MNKATINWDIPAHDPEADYPQTATLPFSFPFSPYNTGQWSIERYVYKGAQELDKCRVIVNWENLDGAAKAPGTLLVETWAWQDPAHPVKEKKTTMRSEFRDELGMGLSGKQNIRWSTIPHRIQLTATWNSSAATTNVVGPSFHNVSSLCLLTCRGNCVLRFPRENRLLFMERWVLEEIPYFENLFESGLVESQSMLVETLKPDRKRRRTSKALEKVKVESPPPEDASKSEYESDLEEDVDSHDPTSEATEYSIPITFASCKTFKCLLQWFITGHVPFATLRTTSGPIPPTNADEDSPIDSDLVSPRSIFRLAHFLQVEDLPAIALREVERQLTKDTVLNEVFGATSRKYPEYQAMAIGWAVKNWGLVEETGLMDKVESLLKDGAIEDGGMISFKLMRAVSTSLRPTKVTT